MAEIQALISALPGEHPPVDFQAAWQEAGFSCQPTELAVLKEIRVTLPTLTVLWTGHSWNRGTEQLAGLPRPLRMLTILVGDSPSKKVVNKIREIGGLGGFTWPLPTWAPLALAGAVGHSSHPADSDLVSALESLEVEVLRLPEELLDRTVKAAQRLTGSDLALMLLGSPKAGSAYVLSTDTGEWRLERGPDVAERLGVPLELVHSIPSTPKLLPGPTSLFVVPLVARPPGIAGSFKRLDGAILLSWKTPHLPTALDLQHLKALGAVARVALLRLSDLAVAATRQRILSDALVELSRFPRGDLGGDYASSVRNMLFAFAGCPGLLGLWALISTSNRQEGTWLSFPIDPEMPRPEPIGGPMEEYSGPYEEVQGAWVLSRPFPSAPGFGQLIAVFDSQTAAASGKTRMQQLSDNLFLAARLIRRTKYSSAMDSLSRQSEQQSALELTGEAVRACLDADGAKIFVIERDPNGNKIRQLFSTLATGQAEIANETVHFKFENKGFADWVLAKGDWLLIPERGRPEETGIKKERCETGRHAEILLTARQEAEYAPGLPREKRDQEKTMLFFPLASGSHVAGVLAVWRNSPHPFHRDLDVEALAYLAPHVAAICQSALRTEKAAQQEAETARLAQGLSVVASLADAYRAVARGVGKIAEAACAVFLHHDPEDPGTLRQSALWMAEGTQTQNAEQPDLSSIAVGEASTENWAKAFEGYNKGRFAGLRFRSLLVPPQDSPRFAVALFDPADDETERLFFADDLLEHFARSYLQFASGLLATHVSAFASRLLDEIGGPFPKDPKTPQLILERAAEILKKATNADAVLVYTGTLKHMKVRFSEPKNDKTLDLDVLPDSLSADSLESRMPKRLVEVERATQKAHRERLHEIARFFGWQRVHSWLCCPIVHEAQRIGLIKLLTREGGVVFGKDHEEISRVVAERAALEMYKAGRRVVLEDLLKLSNKLAGKVGAELGQSMVESLQIWVKDRLLRPRCEVAVVSRLETGGTLIKKASSGVTPRVLDCLDTLSVDWSMAEKTWNSGSLILQRESREILPAAGHGAPIRLPGPKLLGYLILLDEESFEKDEIEAIHQAANYLAGLLNGEQERLMEKQEMGRFRHAVIGPVQGVTSAALLLASLAEEAGAEKAQVKKLRTRLNVEAQVVRLWRENQRFYQNESVEIRPRRQELKPVITRCIERFRDMLDERGIILKLDWPYKGGLTVPFDADAIDLVLSNLLDNARKYSFYNQTVTVGAQLREKDHDVAIWVEDFGHGIPDEKDIYALGKRFVKADPIRTIGGEGLGLAMSNAVITAHGGKLDHKSIPPEGRASDSTPHRVRFTFTLPLSWRPH